MKREFGEHKVNLVLDEYEAFIVCYMFLCGSAILQRDADTAIEIAQTYLDAINTTQLKNRTYSAIHKSLLDRMEKIAETFIATKDEDGE